MAIFETVLKSDLKKPVQVKPLTGNLFSADNGGNKITVEVYDNNSPVTLSGEVTGYIIRDDNATVTVEGTLSQNKASIILPLSAYAVVGRVSIVIKNGETTLGACTAYVYRTTTDTIVDPSHIIPSIEELLEKISDCEAATTAANKVANLTVSAEAASGSTPDAILSETGSGLSAHKHIIFKLVKGDKGDTGNTGATPDFSIGTVSTVAASEGADASITGTADAPVLNLSIPRGVSGNESIDDTKGIGDTDYVWSADKVAKELNEKAPAIIETIDTPAAIVSFSDGADDLPMALTVGIEPVQDLHGYESPYPGGGGKNKFDIGTVFSDTSKFTINGNAVTGTASNLASVSMSIPSELVGQQLTFSANINVPSSAGSGYMRTRAVVGGTNSNGNVISAGTPGLSKVTFTPASTSDTVVFAFGNMSTDSVVISEIQIEVGSTNTDFAPYSNICPITGFTGAELTRTGKNLIDESSITVISGAYIDVTNGDIVTNQTQIYCINDYFKVKTGETYTFGIGKTSSNYNRGVYVVYYDKDKHYLSGENIHANDKLATDVVASFTTPSNTAYVRFTLPPYTAGTIKLAEGTSLDGVGVGQTEVYPITFPSSAGTVYSGTLTVNKDGSGSLVVDKVYNDNLKNRTWTMETTANGNVFSCNAVTGKAQNSNYICNKYKAVAKTRTTIVNGEIGTYNTSNSMNRFSICDNAYSTVADFVASLTDIEVCYEINTPIVYSIAAEQVKTLLGVNNIWADTGDINSVSYTADTKMYIDNLGQTEEDFTANTNIPSGDYFQVGNTLYIATAAIASGETIVPGTNCTKTTLADVLNADATGVSY